MQNLPEKQDRGRPSGYNPDMLPIIRKFVALGATDVEIADMLEIDPATFYRWKHDHESFCEAINTSKAHADQRIERSLYQKACGYTYKEDVVSVIKTGQYETAVEVTTVERQQPPDTAAMIFWLKNRKRGEWNNALGEGETPPVAGEMDMRKLAVAMLSILQQGVQAPLREEKVIDHEQYHKHSDDDAQRPVLRSQDTLPPGRDEGEDVAQVPERPRRRRYKPVG